MASKAGFTLKMALMQWLYKFSPARDSNPTPFRFILAVLLQIRT